METNSVCHVYRQNIGYLNIIDYLFIYLLIYLFIFFIYLCIYLFVYLSSELKMEIVYYTYDLPKPFLEKKVKYR